MAEDRYRLGPLRTVREQAEVAGRGNLATAIDSAGVTAQHLADRAARTTLARAALTSAIEAKVRWSTALDLARADRFIARRRHELEIARDEEIHAQLAHDHREGEVAIAREKLARARADREIVERHFTRWRDDRRKRADNAAD